MSMLVFFTQSEHENHNAIIDTNRYAYHGEEQQVPPMTCVICVPCRNLHPRHRHNIRDCTLMTYNRGWDHLQSDDFVTVYILDNDTGNETLTLEDGEILGAFLLHNQETFGAAIDRCIMGVEPYFPLAMEEDDGYISAHGSDDGSI